MWRMMMMALPTVTVIYFLLHGTIICSISLLVIEEGGLEVVCEVVCETVC